MCRKSLLLILSWFMFSGQVVTAQRVYHNQFRVYVDEDYLNIRGAGTDKGYSSGVQLSFLFNRPQSHFFINRLFPKADSSASNTYNLGFSYLVFTPDDLGASAPEIHDYPYAAGALLNYGLQSFDHEKKFAIQSKISVGVMGPMLGAKSFQVGIHKMIADQVPEGWDNQLANNILINLQLGAEKNLLQAGNFFDVLAGGSVAAGSFIDNAEVYGQARLGIMNNYFSGQIEQNGAYGKWQVYLFAKSGARWTAYNALLQGGIILQQHEIYRAAINHFNTYFNYGLTLVYHNFSAAFTQKAYSSLIKGLSSEETGNITLYFSW